MYDITDRQKICHKVQAGKRLAQIENMSEVLDRIEKFNLKQQEKQGLYDLKQSSCKSKQIYDFFSRSLLRQYKL